MGTTASRPTRAGIIGAALGAGAATVVLITVYEGKVLTAAPGDGGSAEVQAGQVARISGSAPPTVTDSARAALGPQGSTSSVVDRRQARQKSGASTRGARQTTAAARAVELQAEVDRLRARLTKLTRKDRRYGLTKEELRGLAKRCELRWDMPSLTINAPSVSGRVSKKLGLVDGEKAGVKRGLARYHKQMTAELRRIYIRVTGNLKGADALSPAAMREEIADKSPKSETRRVYQRLARERAGLQAPPAPSDLAKASPLERLMRLLTTAGDRAEREVGKEVGPDLARRYRAANNGFGSRSRSSHGCPKR